jgi:O-6-methylguanine DNA methyltransferase
LNQNRSQLQEAAVSFVHTVKRVVRNYKKFMRESKNNQSFSEKVHVVVKTIPAGKTLTYSEVARRAGSPHAARAVARVMSSNYDTQIPCHRVVRADGTLGGYNRGGENIKRELLRRESLTGKNAL